MEKLEFKHFAPYLPYNLQIKNSIGKVIELVFSDAPYHFKKGFKPILRPLSDLTKEIEYNGEIFIPIYKLFEIEYKGTTHFENVRKMYFEEVGRFITCSHFGTAATTYINVLNLEKNNYWKIQKLHEWHFDVYALINNGLAVDVNTLKS